MLNGDASKSSLRQERQATSYHLIMASTRDLPRLTERLALDPSGTGQSAGRDRSLCADAHRGLDRAKASATSLGDTMASSMDGASKALATANQWINKVGQPA